MPEGTLKALAGYDQLGEILPVDGGDFEKTLAQFAKTGIEIEALAIQLQDDGAKALVKSWTGLISVIESKKVKGCIAPNKTASHALILIGRLEDGYND